MEKTNIETFRHVMTMVGANASAQIIAFLVYPLLTRLYSASDFGTLNLFMSIGGIITLFATAEYQYAIVLPKENKDAAACFQVGFVILLAVTAFTSFSVCFSSGISNLFNAPGLSDFYCLMPLFVFFGGFWNLLNYWYTRHKKYSIISVFQLLQSVATSSFKYISGVLGFLDGGLIFSTVFGILASLGMAVSTSFKSLVKPLFAFHKIEFVSASKNYSNFPKYSLPRAVVNNFSGNLPILLLTSYFGLSEIGFFGMALTLAFRPINMVSNSLYQVFFQKTALQVCEKQHIKSFFLNFLKNVFVVVIPCFTVLYFVLPSLTEWLLGKGWGITGEYIRIMLPWLAMSVFVAPICFLSDVFSKQKLGLFFEITLFVARFVGIAIGVYFQSFTYAIGGYCMGSALVVFAQLVWYVFLVRSYERSIVD